MWDEFISRTGEAMDQEPDKRFQNPRSGIALIIVLGFLSILVVMGVAFAVFSRTERMASRAYADVVKSRQIAQAGLARTLSELDQMLVADGTSYPSWTIKLSPGGSPYQWLASNNDPKSFVPRTAWETATSVFNIGGGGCGMRDIRDITGTNVLGRYAYMIVNCSGLLDANYIGGSNRMYGSSPYEIALSNAILTEVTDTGVSDIPSNRRTTWKRFETIPDLYAVCSAPPAAVNTNLFPSLSNLFTYSRAPAGWWDTAGGTVQTQVYIGGNALLSDVSMQAAVVSAFSRIAGTDATALRDALMDYIDTDFQPRSVTNGTVEATPLINEITIEQEFTVAGVNVCRPSVEVWFPFVAITNPNNYRLALAITFTNAVPAEYNPQNGGTAGRGQYGVTYTFPGAWSTPGYRVVGFPQIAIAQGSSTNPLVSLNNLEAVITAELRENTSSGPRVDYVQNVTCKLSFASSTPGAAAQVGGVAVTDPRLNHKLDQWKQIGASPGAVGSPTLNAFNTGVAGPLAADGGMLATELYIANQPLRSTGELGLLFSGVAPWQSIRLLGAGSWPVLDYFTAVTGSVFKGRVNVNTPNQAVLASALLGANAERYPGQGGAATRLDVVAANTLASQIISALSASPLVNMSDIAGKFAAGTFTGYGPLESEGILRTTADLLTPRQQMFTLFVVAQYVDPLGSPGAEQRLLAVVWRDPYRNANGVNEMFVRFFKWLTSLQ